MAMMVFGFCGQYGGLRKSCAGEGFRMTSLVEVMQVENSWELFGLKDWPRGVLTEKYSLLLGGKS